MKVRTLFNEINQRTPEDRLKYDSRLKAFIAKYEDRSTREVEWLELCSDVREYGCYRYGLALLVSLLENKQYHGHYSEFLYSNLPALKKISQQNSTHYQKLFCGEDIKNLIICSIPDRGKNHTQLFIIVRTENKEIIKLFSGYLENKSHHADIRAELCALFGESLGEYENRIHSAADFSERTLFQQVAYYKRKYNCDPKTATAGICLVLHFYRWLIRLYPDFDYFADSFRMSERLLFSSALPELIMRDYYFTTLNPANIPYGKERICFIMKGFERQSTRITSDDFVSMDLSGLKCDLYRDLLIEFTATSTSASSVKWIGIAMYIVEAIQNIYVVKQNPFYPNKNPRYLTTQEAVFIRQYFNAQSISVRTKNNKIGAARRFIQFCVDKKAIQVDALFFDYLIQYEEPNKNTAKTIPDDALVKLHEYFVEKGKNDVFYQEVLVIFHLLLQTEFRINQICHLDVDCIRPTLKPNQYEVVSISKTTHGKKKSSVISTTTYNLLMDIIEKTEPIRESCPIGSLKKYIFVYSPPFRKTTTNLFSDSTFGVALRNACNDLGIEHYTASNLRDTHMTKALEHIMRNGKSNIEMSVLSKHKFMDTTKNHYIEMELEKMLESTYGIIIGSNLVNTDGKILNEIPDKLQSPEHDVENGCGKCSAGSCVVTNALPCLVCSHFVTTIQHKAYFIKAIENIDRLIRLKESRHDKEDLITIKELYVHYLKAIMMKEEETANDD